MHLACKYFENIHSLTHSMRKEAEECVCMHTCENELAMAVQVDWMYLLNYVIRCGGRKEAKKMQKMTSEIPNKKELSKCIAYTSTKKWRSVTQWINEFKSILWNKTQVWMQAIQTNILEIRKKTLDWFQMALKIQWFIVCLFVWNCM